MQPSFNWYWTASSEDNRFEWNNWKYFELTPFWNFKTVCTLYFALFSAYFLLTLFTSIGHLVDIRNLHLCSFQFAGVKRCFMKWNKCFTFWSGKAVRWHWVHPPNTNALALPYKLSLLVCFCVHINVCVYGLLYRHMSCNNDLLPMHYKKCLLHAAVLTSVEKMFN